MKYCSSGINPSNSDIMWSGSIVYSKFQKEYENYSSKSAAQVIHDPIAREGVNAYFILLIIIGVFIPFSMKAQFSEQYDITSSVSWAQDVFALDIDGDTDLDILIASEGDNKISLYENLGNGEFGDQIVITNLAWKASSVFAADLDGDGDQDVLSTSWLDNKIAWYENLGDLNFGDQIVLSQEFQKPRDIHAADLDGDGNMDVLIASSDDNTIALFENDGFGTFSSPVILDSGLSEAYGVKTADIDNDGDLDIIGESRANNGVVLYANDGMGSFEDSLPILTGVDIRSVRLADLNGDELLDIYCVRFSQDNVLWIPNEGSGSFGSPIILDFLNGASAVYADDIDLDGDLDLIAGGSLQDYDLRWYENQGSGLFSGGISISTGNISNALYSGNLYGSSTPEIISAGNEVILFEVDQLPFVFTSQQFSFSNETPFSLNLEDLDGDQDIDIVLLAGWPESLISFENQGDGQFGNRTVLVENIISTQFYTGLAVGDIDLDGDIDYVTGSTEENRTSWYENTGNQNPLEEHIINEESPFSANLIKASDLDGDGDLDLVISSDEDGMEKTFWLENLGGGVFSEELILGASFGCADIDIGDIDMDGDMDIVIARMDNDAVIWFRNEGNTVFSTQPIIDFNGSHIYDLDLVDMDKDGTKDLLVAIDGQLSILFNTGGAEFTSPFPIDILDSPSGAFAFDFDHDGDMDIAVTEWSDDKVLLYRRLSSGQYASEITIDANVVTAMEIEGKDLDGDDDIDLIITSNDEGKVASYTNFRFHPHQLTGKVFFDSNQNGEYDPIEVGLPDLPITSNPFSDVAYTNGEGDFSFVFSDVAGLYAITPPNLEGWTLTTQPETFNIEIDSSWTSSDDLNFGFYPDSFFTAIERSIVGGYPRCNDTINYWVNLSNIGTTTPEGIFEVHLDDSVGFVNSSIPTDSIVGQNIFFHFDSLPLFGGISFELQVSMPALNLTENFVESSLTIFEVVNGTQVEIGSDSLFEEVVCAYDPNDKTVNPSGIGSEGYIPLGQELEYLIRFQNTGNDTAFTVVIVDQLSEYLDVATFNPITSSDPMEVSVDQFGEVSFTFENIMLPDSNIDFLGSQGFVQYRINAKEDLDPNTEIRNYAAIFFDLNPPIITDTTLSTIECYSIPEPIIAFNYPHLIPGVLGEFQYQWFFNGEPLPEAQLETLVPEENGFYSVEITDIYACKRKSEPYEFNSLGVSDVHLPEFTIYPNPFESSFAIRIPPQLKGNYELIIHSIEGREIFRENILTADEYIIDSGFLQSGTYLLTLKNKETGEAVLVEKIVCIQF